MCQETENTLYLRDYQPPYFHISEAHLTFHLDHHYTKVHSRLHCHRSALNGEKKPLFLNGIGLQLIELIVDEKVLGEDQYQISDEGITLHDVPDNFVIKIKNGINPSKNKALYGLYESNGFICSHNEPEGFRNITFFIDRPDVFAKITTTLIGDKNRFPVMLANGNLIEKKSLSEGLHQVTYEDPFPKPCYLFACVAGKLDEKKEVYRTMSGKNVDLLFYTEPGKSDRALFALECLKNAMRFDEEVFKLEYDLSCYMIVAVDFFNMGAMENKGLNIFNTATCFADPHFATDDNFARVETVVGHEYFHNYSGNRVGVKNWFQLTLKEGLTVFRDQEFTCYLHDRTVKRIEDVTKLRSRQFLEDLGPTAHPILPKSYVEINNFYTPTIYDKGAEVVRMKKTLLGDELFYKGCQLFFERNDGLPATVEDWLSAMETASQRSLEQFRRWYDQSGLLSLEADWEYQPQHQRIELTIRQKMINGSHSDPLLFPFKIGCLTLSGQPGHFFVRDCRREQDSAILEVSKKEQVFYLEEVQEEMVLSLNRDFSVPCLLKASLSAHDRCHLALHDTDGFNRFEAMQTFAKEVMQAAVVQAESNEPITVDTRFLALVKEILFDPTLTMALKAKLLKLPTENELALEQEVISIKGNHAALIAYSQAIAHHFQKEWRDLFNTLSQAASYHYDQDQVGARRLKNLALYYISHLEISDAASMISRSYFHASNMTERYAALELLCQLEVEEQDKALEHFYCEFSHDPLVMIKWLACQAQSYLPGTLDRVKKLTQVQGVNMKLPNHIRALMITFCDNTVVFHDALGAGYEFYFDVLADVDGFNSQTAAILAQALKRMSKMPSSQKEIFRQKASAMMNRVKLSKNVLEVLEKMMTA
jgi:aminopeptidase N